MATSFTKKDISNGTRFTDYLQRTEAVNQVVEGSIKTWEKRAEEAARNTAQNCRDFGNQTSDGGSEGVGAKLTLGELGRFNRVDLSSGTVNDCD